MWFWRVMNMLTGLSPLIIYLIGGIMIIKFGVSGLTIGDITVIVTLLGRLYRPVDQLFGIQVDIVRSMALFVRIFEYYDMPVEIETPPDAITPKQAFGHVEFKNVHFRYTGDKEILRGIDFNLTPGKTVALVGTSGAENRQSRGLFRECTTSPRVPFYLTELMCAN